MSCRMFNSYRNFVFFFGLLWTLDRCNLPNLYVYEHLPLDEMDILIPVATIRKKCIFFKESYVLGIASLVNFHLHSSQCVAAVAVYC
jgi:hypothetical protein